VCASRRSDCSCSEFGRLVGEADRSNCNCSELVRLVSAAK